MIGLLQRVQCAQVDIGGRLTGRIDAGILVFVGIEREDTESTANRLLERLLGFRVFADQQGKMNRSVRDVGGGVLLVPQFTLAADTSSGMRPSFTTAASPERGRALFEYLVERASAVFSPVASGEFGSDMQISLVNDGPVTFWIRVPVEVVARQKPDIS